MLTIHNVRLGLACNSSSSHSMVLIPPGEAHEESPDSGEVHFGWDNFTLTQERSKLNYLAVVFRDSLRAADIHGDVVRVILSDAFGPEAARAATNEDSWDEFDGYIDHESMWYIPREHGTAVPSLALAKELAAYFRRPDVVVLGGNDNSDGHPLREDYPEAPLPLKRFVGEVSTAELKAYVCRKDPAGFWSIFNQKTGAKIRFSVGQNEGIPERAETPELVDVKITGFCDIGCSFCYQDSTPEQGHATLEGLRSLARVLGDLNVFEVALGGGEPTKHPAFIRILEAFRDEDVVPNFTTRSPDWLRDGRTAEIVKRTAGAVAYSVGSLGEAQKVVEAWKAAGLYPKGSDRYRDTYPKLNLQLVLGVVPLRAFEEICRWCSEGGGFRWGSHPVYGVTLLGFKHVGRGVAGPAHPYDGWLELCQRLNAENKLPNLSVDTAVVAEFGSALEAAGVNRRFYHAEEGRFSCYYDATTGKLALSSYCDPSLYVQAGRRNQATPDIYINEENFLEAYGKVVAADPDRIVLDQ